MSQPETRSGPGTFRLAIVAIVLLLVVAAVWYTAWWYLSSRSSEENKLRRLTAEIQAGMRGDPGADGSSSGRRSGGSGAASTQAPSTGRTASGAKPLHLDTFTATPEDGPISESGPGDETGAPRPSGVTYLTGGSGAEPARAAPPSPAR